MEQLGWTTLEQSKKVRIQRIYTNGTKYNMVEWPRYNVDYTQTRKVPYIESTIHRKLSYFGWKGNVCIIVNQFVDDETNVLMVVVRTKGENASISIPFGQFGHYFRKK